MRSHTTIVRQRLPGRRRARRATRRRCVARVRPSTTRGVGDDRTRRPTTPATRAATGPTAAARPRRDGESHRDSTHRSSCSCSGSTQAQFAGYFAAQRPGLLRRLVPRRRDHRGRRRHRAAAAAGRRRGRLRASRGCPRRSPAARPGRTSSTSPRSSSARARCRCRSSTTDITTPADFAGKNDRQLGLRQRVRDLRRARPRPTSTRRAT